MAVAMTAAVKVALDVETPEIGNLQAIVLLLFPEVDPVSGSSLSCVDAKTRVL